MKLPISKQVLISAFTDMLASPIYNVSYVYLETESTIKKEIEKWNNDIDNDVKNDPTGWHPNKREWNPDNYPKVGRDLYAVTYVRAVKSYNITFKDFVCGFLEIKDEDHIPLGIISNDFPMEALLQWKDALKFGRFDSWLKETKEGWKHINNIQPEEYQDVLVHIPNHRPVIKFYNPDMETWDDDDNNVSPLSIHEYPYWRDM